MCFPKSNAVIVLFAFLFFNWHYINAQEKLVANDNTAACTFDSYKLDLLVKNDSLYKATILLNDAISFSKKYNLKTTLAKSYNALGNVLTKMSNFKKAESYLEKSLHIYDSLNNKKGQDLVLSGLINSYTQEKNYTKFDSIYPKAQLLSKSLNSEIYFINLENKVKRDYYNFNNKSLLEMSNMGLELLNNTDFSTLNISKEYHTENLKQNLIQSFKYYNALAQIKIDQTNPKNYNLLFSLSDEKLKAALNTDINSYRKLATFNYYKYLYYTYAKKDLDSANKYILKSDNYKYDALANIENKNNRNGDLVYKIIDAEQKLNLTKEIQKKEAKNSQTFLISTIIVSTLLLITLTIFYFYFKAKRNILLINDALKASNSKLIAIDKDRLEFFSILSHELRTPIYGISGLATLIDQESDDTKKQSYLDSLISSSNYLSILIDNILQANRLKFEKKNLRLKPGKMAKIVNHVMSTVAVAAKNKGLELKVHIDKSDDQEFILVDKVAFSQILINLAYNAIRYTKTGSITINVFEKKRDTKNITLRFEVKDTGIGIKEEHRSIVFSAFENKTFLNKNSSGSGLGLYIVKTLLKSHDSDIDFVSTPNEGTCFFFEITFTLATNEESQGIISVKPHRDMRILVVDDNKINLLITKKNIEKIEGYSCQTISNGKEAISLVKAKDFDLVLMDINMPDMDGYDVTKHIRMFNTTIPILALTALNSNEISLRAEASGIDQIITKPYIFEDFKAIITSYSGSNDNYCKIIDAEAI
ncbi:response regulator [Winogradskyella thalassocola]|uniref:histidine kinase n=1 Tax=Winogradskyella thalassocola TaxID=262004 RepID=A0A1G7YDG6_9FLAO|nr:response regulator [Winogradskyella thalassocola]SDG94551.1 His Kinase A (phospho-acceptor) domain-containing protein [Winogradskyella thalassocola]